MLDTIIAAEVGPHPLVPNCLTIVSYASIAVIFPPTINLTVICKPSVIAKLYIPAFCLISVRMLYYRCSSKLSSSISCSSSDSSSSSVKSSITVVDLFSFVSVLFCCVPVLSISSSTIFCTTSTASCASLLMYVPC